MMVLGMNSRDRQNAYASCAGVMPASLAICKQGGMASFEEYACYLDDHRMTMVPKPSQRTASNWCPIGHRTP